MEKNDQKKMGAKIMRKIIVITAVALMVLAFYAGNAHAVTGQCSNCHTMHDSQQRTGGTSGTDVGEAGQQSQLLKAGCVTCHTGPHGSGGDGRNDSYSAPVVLDTVAPADQGGTDTLAGGDFYWVNNDETNDAEKGHNVLDLPGVTGADTNTGLTPPGWDQEPTTGLTLDAKTLQVTGGAGWTDQLTCAGTFGCHGYRDAAGTSGLSGAHHGNSGTDDQVNAAPSNVAGSYRFLAGIMGLEHVNHNWNETVGSHNEYYGVDDTNVERDNDATDVYNNTNTISFLCAECHGEFHSKLSYTAGTFASPWARHPTDIVLPSTASKPYDDYNSDNGDDTPGNYNVDIPLARGSVPAASSSTVTIDTSATGAIVMCLSCHRAHGSPYDDLLRFDYTAITVGAGTTVGCFVCHTDTN